MVRTVRGIPVLNEAAIIPFKDRAWLDLCRERVAGNDVSARNVKKHRNDIAGLLQLVSPEARHAVPDAVADDLRALVDGVFGEEDKTPGNSTST